MLTGRLQHTASQLMRHAILAAQHWAALTGQAVTAGLQLLPVVPSTMRVPTTYNSAPTRTRNTPVWPHQ